MDKDLEILKQFVELHSIKNVLILENQTLDHSQRRFVKELEDVGCIVVVAEHAHLDESKKKIMQALPTTDTIFFESQFLYWEQVQGVGKLLMNMPKPLKVFGRNVTNASLMRGIEDTFDVKDLAAMSHHEVYELNDNYTHSRLLKNVKHMAEKKDMLRFKIAIEAEERKKAKAIADAPKEKRRQMEIQMRDVKPTGRKVRILIDTLGQGPQWANLKKDMEVEELDCLHMDPNPDRGVWVMGLHEPVKLLNDTGYNEWEYVEPDSVALGLEILARCSKRADESYILPFIPWISKVVPAKVREKEEAEIHMHITELLDACGVPRRMNRDNIVQKLIAYGKNHQYFGDDRIILNRKVNELANRAKARKAIIFMDQAAKRVAQDEVYA